MPKEVQVFEGNGARHRRPGKPKIIKWNGYLRFELEGLPGRVHYAVTEERMFEEPGDRPTFHQRIRFDGCGLITTIKAEDWINKEPEAKLMDSTHKGEDCFLLGWPTTKENLLAILMDENGNYLTRRARLHKKYGRKRIHE